RRHRARGAEPGHSLFHPANFFGGSRLHADGYRPQTLEPWRVRVAGNTADLALQLAIACRIDVSERRRHHDQRLRVCDTARDAKNAQELVAFPPDAAEHA